MPKKIKSNSKSTTINGNKRTRYPKNNVTNVGNQTSYHKNGNPKHTVTNNKRNHTSTQDVILNNKNNYTKYLCKLLKDERFELRIFQKEKDLELYTYFLPKIRDFLFRTFEFNKSKSNRFNELPVETQAALLSEYPSVTFECNLSKDMQGKTIDENSIFFKIQKIGIVCFNTGICFLYIKTNVEESKQFADVLNFNYKFRDINQEYHNLKDLIDLIHSYNIKAGISIRMDFTIIWLPCHMVKRRPSCSRHTPSSHRR